MGGHYQPMGHGHLLTRMIDDGLDLQAAIDAPRAHRRGKQCRGTGMRRDARGLIERATMCGRIAVGGGQAIGIDWDGAC